MKARGLFSCHEKPPVKILLWAICCLSKMISNRWGIYGDTLVCKYFCSYGVFCLEKLSQYRERKRFTNLNFISTALLLAGIAKYKSVHGQSLGRARCPEGSIVASFRTLPDSPASGAAQFHRPVPGACGEPGTHKTIISIRRIYWVMDSECRDQQMLSWEQASFTLLLVVEGKRYWAYVSQQHKPHGGISHQNWLTA